MKTRCLALCLLILLLAACGDLPTVAPPPGQDTPPSPTVDSYPMPQVTSTPDPYPRVIPTDVPWTPVHPSPPPNVPILGNEWAPLEERETYVSTTVVVAPVGDGPGEIGYLVDARYGLPVRASHFALDGQGNLYILDLVNRRVVQFDANGGFVANIVYGDTVRELKSAADLAVDPEGRVYIYDTGASVGTNLEDMAPKVRLFDRQGTMLRVYPVPSWFSGGQIHAMRVDEQGILWVEGNGSYQNAPIIESQRYATGIVPLGNANETFDEQYQRTAAVPGLMCNTGTYFSYIVRDSLYLYDSQGHYLYECPHCTGRFEMDTEGNMYLRRYIYTEGQTSSYTVEKYNPQGRTVAAFGTPIGTIRVDETGAVYCLVFDQQSATHYQVIRWQRQ